MIDYKILEAKGVTKARLREIFTASMPENFKQLTDEEQKKIEKDIAIRKRFEKRAGDRLMEHINYGLENYQMYSAVDVAWDSAPINKAAIPLMLYAQGKLDLGACATSLCSLGFDKYVSRNPDGTPIAFDLPKFYEVHVNLIRSVITRRVAAQVNKYNRLWPYFKYESRSTSLVGKLRADVMSQIADEMADNYGYRHHDAQVYRETFLYAHVIDFVRSGWEKEKQWRRIPLADGVDETPETMKLEEVIVKEGVAFTNPHITRTFSDNAYPLASLNSDTGCSYVGFWDVVRWRDVGLDVQYWNRDKITFGSNVISLFTTYSAYFSQYFCTVTPPVLPSIYPVMPGTTGDLSSGNDRAANVGLYAGTQEDCSMILARYFEKVNPKNEGIGDYPYDVWMRLDLAGDNTIIWAEVLPSTPCAVDTFNENDGRLINISLAHELLGYQDQLTNLLSYLLLTMQANNVRVMIVNTDAADKDAVKAFREQIKGSGAYTGTTVLEVSRSKMGELGMDVEKVVQLIETKALGLDIIFKAIAQLIALVERLMALSPQEQGQPAPREISATETNAIGNTTSSVQDFVSSGHDEFREAKKRIIYESYMACGNDELRVPVMERYSPKVIKAAGFTYADGEFEHSNVPPKDDVMRYTVLGTKQALEQSYIFSSRDGDDRAVNTQSANVLVQLLNVIKDPTVINAIGKEKYFDMLNEIMRLSGAGFDLRLEKKEGESDEFTGGDEEQMKQVAETLQQLADVTGKNTQSIQEIQQAIQKIVEATQQQSAPPPTQPPAPQQQSPPPMPSQIQQGLPYQAQMGSFGYH